MIRFSDAQAPKPRPAARIIGGLKEAIAHASSADTGARVIRPKAKKKAAKTRPKGNGA